MMEGARDVETFIYELLPKTTIPDASITVGVAAVMEPRVWTGGVRDATGKIHATLNVSIGALLLLSDWEMKVVIAHEIAHLELEHKYDVVDADNHDRLLAQEMATDRRAVELVPEAPSLAVALLRFCDWFSEGAEPASEMCRDLTNRAERIGEQMLD
jgi:hypothetical protein